MQDVFAVTQRMIAHVFVDENGNLSVTPCAHASDEDIARLQAIWRHRFVTVDERLFNAR